MPLIVVTPAAVEPVTVAEAKEHLRVTHSADDSLIGALITAAREAVEMETSRALAAATYRYVGEGDLLDELRIPLWPVASVSAVTYEDTAGDRQTLAGADYALDADRSLLLIDPLPVGCRPSVTFAVTPTSIPTAVVAAIKLLVADMYANAESHITGTIVAENTTVDRLLYPHRVTLGV